MKWILTCLLAMIVFEGFCQKALLIVGTYTNTGSKGIYVYRFDAEDGTLQLLSNTEGVVNPSYLDISPDKKFVYACTNTRTADTGSISSFKIDRNTGKLLLINKQQSGGANPVYIDVHAGKKWIVVGNYTGGNLVAMAVNKDGSLKAPAQVVQHYGSSVIAERQNMPHVHSTVFSPDQRYIYVPDLGLDKIMIYRFQQKGIKPLQSATPPFVKTTAGSGPRHFSFHPNKRFAYLVEEMSGTVVAFKYNSTNGGLDSVQRITAHAAEVKGPYSSADIHISPDGRFLYTSNRGTENNIAIFSVDPSTGMLRNIGYQSTLGLHPRNFTIDATGKYLLVANMLSDDVVVFKRDLETGLLTPTKTIVSVPQPSCLKMM